MSHAIDYIEAARNDARAGRISRDAAILIICNAINVTQACAEDLLDHPIAPRARYEAAALRGQESGGESS